MPTLPLFISLRLRYTLSSSYSVVVFKAEMEANFFDFIPNFSFGSDDNILLQNREKLYLLAVGHYISVDYMMSRYFVDECLRIAPNWRPAQILKKKVEDQIKHIQSDGVALVAAGWIVAALTRKK